MYSIFASFYSSTTVPDSLDPDQTPRCVGSDLGLNCLEILSADNTSVSMSDLGPNCLQRFLADSTSMSDMGPNCLKRLSADSKSM